MRNTLRAGFPKLLTFSSRYWCGLFVVYMVLDVALFRSVPFGTDWAPVWVAGQLGWTDPERVYDFNFVSALQIPVLGQVPDRPFVYPPSALILFAPLALFPFWVSLAVFACSAAFLLARVSGRVGSDRLILLVAPPVVLAAVAGQPSLLVAGLAVAGCFSLSRNEHRAGLLLGFAAMIKPPLLLLAPVALAAGGHWRALWTGAWTASTLAAVSVILFGFQPWLDWLAALPRFQQLFADFEPLVRNAITPHALAVRYGMDSSWIVAVAALVAVPTVILTFARTSDVALRIIAMVGGALLITPYSMNYELAMLAPAVASMRLERLRDMGIPLVWGASLFATASFFGLIAVYAWLLANLLNISASASQDRFVQGRVNVPA